MYELTGEIELNHMSDFRLLGLQWVSDFKSELRQRRQDVDR